MADQNFVVHDLTPEDVSQGVTDGRYLLIDVREPNEVAAEAYPDAVVVPLSTFDPNAIPDPRFGSLVGATVLFFIPTVFSGMISPYAVRLIVPDRSSSGRHAGQLYFVSTFGSAAGTLLTSFYLVLIMEVNHILIALMTISGVIGVTACLVRGEANAQ